MKKLYILLLITLSLSCKAQQHTLSLYQDRVSEQTPDYYLKDVNNDFDKFLGTWKWENGNTSITFQLEKEIKYQLDANYNYEDILVGEYKYLENGIEKVNTLPRLQDSSIEGYDHKISGNRILNKLHPPKCDTCDASERRIALRIEHHTAEDIVASLVLRYINDNGVEKLEVKIGKIQVTSFVRSSRTEPLEFDFPIGNYILIKQ